MALGGVSQHMGEQEIQEYIKEIRRIGQICREQGIALAVHGSTDFYQRDGGGVLLLERVLGEIAPEYLEAQIDTAWAVCAGEDPVRLIETYKDRIYTVHIKDFHPPIPSAGDIYARKEEALTRDSAVGDNGVIDLLGVIRASREAGAKWLIVEHMERESYEDSISATRVSLGNIRNTGVIEHLCGLTVNIFCRCVIAILISQPLVNFDNHVSNAENLKRITVSFGFLLGGIVFRILLRPLPGRRIRTLLGHSEHLSFVLKVMTVMFLYLFFESVDLSNEREWAFA